MIEQSLRCEDFSLVVDQRISVASLRYVESATVSGLLRDFTGLNVPGTGQALQRSAQGAAPPDTEPQHTGPQHTGPQVAGPEWVLAWRNPTETLILTTDSPALTAFAARLADATDACLVAQTGGIWVLRLTGPRVADVLVRLGSTTAIPAEGQALTGRLAEITVTAVRVQEGEILLLVDRLYADHLFGWIRETIADF